MSLMGPAKKHVDELLKLPPDERSEAAEALLLSLEQEPEDQDSVQSAWATEIERRVVDNAAGIPAETVLADGRARLSKRSSRSTRTGSHATSPSARDRCRVDRKRVDLK